MIYKYFNYPAYALRKSNSTVAYVKKLLNYLPACLIKLKGYQTIIILGANYIKQRKRIKNQPGSHEIVFNVGKPVFCKSIFTL